MFTPFTVAIVYYYFYIYLNAGCILANGQMCMFLTPTDWPFAVLRPST